MKIFKTIQDEMKEIISASIKKAEEAQKYAF